MPIARATGSYLSMLQQYLSGVASIAAADIRDGFVDVLQKAVAILEAHAVQENAISVDTNLSEAGQIAKIVEVAKDTLKKLRFLLGQADDAATAFTRLEALLMAVPDAPKGVNELIQFFRESEIRTWLRSLTAPERMTKYQLAVQQGDVETIRAFRLAPGEPLIAKEIQDRFEHQRLELAKPKDLIRLQSLEGVRDQLHDIALQLFRWLEGYGAKFEGPTPTMKSGQHLLGYGESVTFPVPKTKPANFK